MLRDIRRHMCDRVRRTPPVWRETVCIWYYVHVRSVSGRVRRNVCCFCECVHVRVKCVCADPSSSNLKWPPRTLPPNMHAHIFRPTTPSTCTRHIHNHQHTRAHNETHLRTSLLPSASLIATSATPSSPSPGSTGICVCVRVHG